jgi:hypothetical protein
MRTNHILTAALALVAAGALGSACSPEDVPNVPTFETDVRPLMLSRCVRCHGAGGTENADPQQQETAWVGAAPINGYFDHLEDQDCPPAASPPALNCPPAPCKCGLAFYANNGKLTAYIHGTGNARMPPPPTPPLSDRQLQLLDRWAADPI